MPRMGRTLGQTTKHKTTHVCQIFDGDFQPTSRLMLGVVSHVTCVGARVGARVAGRLRLESGLSFKSSSPWSLSPFAVAAAAGAAAAGATAAGFAWIAEESMVVVARVSSSATASPLPFGQLVSCEARAADATVATATEASDAIVVDKLTCSRSLSVGGSRQEGVRAVVLVSCGSFNPPTVAHVKILDMVRAAYIKAGVDVYGAYLSPVHDAYKKPGLVDAHHRVEMCRRAVASSSYVMVDGWEAAQAGYTRTLHVLDSIDARLQAAEGRIEDAEERSETASARVNSSSPRTVLVCGADVLESMGNSELWDQVFLEDLLRRHGVACVVREGTDVERVLRKEGTLVSRWRDHVMVVEAGEKEMASIAGVSSSRVREACRLRGGRGLEGVLDEGVLAYIMRERLYESGIG